MFEHVIKIPQTTKDAPIWFQQLKVAAYCRVSTCRENQKQSLASQISFYTDYIHRNPFWRFVAVYAMMPPGFKPKNDPAISKCLKIAERGESI